MKEQASYRICAFCNEPIDDGSLCKSCMKKFGIIPSDILDEGCGCDTK